MRTIAATSRLPVSVGLALLLAACGNETEQRSTLPAGGAPPSSAGATVTGPRTFVIVPERSRASYRANEEFFAGALNLLGIEAGRIEAVGSTQSIEGRFELDPDRPNVLLGTNAFTVRVNTLISNQSKRDDYVREIRDDGGPSFDAYPVATFRATAVDGEARPGATGREFRLRLTGDLIVRDIAKPATFDVDAQLAGDTLTGLGRTRVLLSAYGIGPIEFSDILRVADDVTLEVQFVARAQ